MNIFCHLLVLRTRVTESTEIWFYPLAWETVAGEKDPAPDLESFLRRYIRLEGDNDTF